MTTDAFCDACLLEKKLLCRWKLWQQKKCKFCTMFWTPKWGLKNEPKNGARIWPPKWSPKMAPQKWGPKMAPKRGPNILIKKKPKLYLHLNPFFGCNFCTPFWGAIFGPHFGGQILAPFLGPFFNPHFGVQNMVRNLQFFCCQSFHLHSNFFQQTCITKCICSHIA